MSSKKGSYGMLNKHHSDESKDKIRNFQLQFNGNPNRFQKGFTPWNKGISVSEERKLHQSKKMKEYYKTHKAHNFVDGIRKSHYDYDFFKIRLKVFERDYEQCQICGLYLPYPFTKEKHCHHIDYDFKNNTMDNLVTLCISCHSKTNTNRDRWIKYFKTEWN